MAVTQTTEEPRPPLLQVVGENVYRRRVLRLPKLSQEELSRRSGVALNTIAVLEAARDPAKAPKANSPKLVTLELLAEALGCEPWDLLRWDSATRVKRNGAKRPRLDIVAGQGNGSEPSQQPLLGSAS
jgi:transcriptional regulator with XRE-family HTH domain